MAEVLASGTGAKAAQVWLMVDGRLRLAATWPAAEGSPTAGAVPGDELAGRRELAVRQAGEVLGVLVVQEHDVPLTPVEERLFAGLADQAGLVLRGARLRAELVHRLPGLSRAAGGSREAQQQ